MNSPKNGILNWPKSERPRELLLEKGPDAVSDAGLIAILLRVGRRGEDAVSIARNLLQKFQSLNGLLNASYSELQQVKGLGSAKIAVLFAVRELVRRQAREAALHRDCVHSSEEVYRLLSLTMRGLKHEVFKVVYLNEANFVIAIEDLFEGTVNRSAIYPREVIRRALELGASGLVFAHNHPSGSFEPSVDDIEVTKKLFRACEAVELRALDHLIITEESYCSVLKAMQG